MIRDLKDLAREAAEIVEDSARVALSYFQKPLLIETKDNQTPVTIADKKTEEKIRAELQRRFPNHGIIGEEFGEESREREWVWTVDPIDGTRSFVRGIPLWGSLVSLLKNNEPVLGIMALPALGELYWAVQGGGTFRNDHPVHVTTTKVLESAFVSCGDFYAFEDAGKREYAHRLMDTAELTRGYCDCFGHSLVMRGAQDAMVDPVVAIWDIAPLALLVEEAGGGYSNFRGERTILDTNFMSFATPELGKALLDL